MNVVDLRPYIERTAASLRAFIKTGDADRWVDEYSEAVAELYRAGVSSTALAEFAGRVMAAQMQPAEIAALGKLLRADVVERLVARLRAIAPREEAEG